MKVLAILPGNPEQVRATDIYRIVGPFAHLKKHTSQDIKWLPDSQFGSLSLEKADKLINSDIIVIARFIHNDLEVVNRTMSILKSRGAKIVYECDDDLTGLYRKDPSGASNLPYFPYIDAVTASTKPLADRMEDISGRKAYHLPNYIYLKHFTETSFSDNGKPRERTFKDTINIMLAGTATHAEDWRMIIELIPGILRDYPNVRVIFAGYKPDFAGEDERICFIPPKPYALYPTMLFEADIVCAGLDPDDPFNWAKSPCKVLESWAAKRTLDNKQFGGAAVIATDCVTYRDTITNGDDGLLVPHKHEEWDRAIRTLLDNETMRRNLQRRGHNTVRKHNIANHYREWISVYNKIVRS